MYLELGYMFMHRVLLKGLAVTAWWYWGLNSQPFHQDSSALTIKAFKIQDSFICQIHSSTSTTCSKNVP